MIGIFTYIFIFSPFSFKSDKIENHRNYINQNRPNYPSLAGRRTIWAEQRSHFTVHRAKKISRLHIYGFGEKKMSSSKQDPLIWMGSASLLFISSSTIQAIKRDFQILLSANINTYTTTIISSGRTTAADKPRKQTLKLKVVLVPWSEWVGPKMIKITSAFRISKGPTTTYLLFTFTCSFTS